MQLDKTETILSYTWKGSNGRWYAFQKNADLWFRLAKRDHSFPYFLVASTLAAMEVWDIIGLKEDHA